MGMVENSNQIYLLYVDDEDILLKSTKLYLEHTGDFIVDTASSGKEGLEKIHSRRYDAVISDYQMPGMDGIDFLKTLRESGNNIPFIIFTGKGREEAAMAALNAGADYYLQKGGTPKVQFGELKNFVRRAVDKSSVEKKLLENERRMEDIINFLPDPTFAIDNDGRVIAWNHAIEEMTGISSSEIIGTDNFEYSLFIYGHRRPALIDLILNRELQKEVSYTVTEADEILYAETFTKKFYDGKGVYLWVKASPLYHADGSIAGAIESMHDISGIKETQKKLIQSKSNFEGIFNNIDDFLFVINEHGFILNVNDTIIKRLVYRKDELLGENILVFHHQEQRKDADSFMNDMLSGKYERHNIFLVAKNGNKIPVETRITGGYWDGKPVFFVVGRDISRLKLSEEKFSAAFNSSASIMAISTKEDGRYIDVNNIFLEKLGYLRCDVIGKSSDDLNLFLSPEVRLKILQILEKKGKVIDLEIPVRKKNKDIMYGLFSASNLTFGDTPCLLTTMVDITASKTAEEELCDTRNRLELAMDASEHGFWDWNLDTDEIYFSPRYYTMLGYEPEEMPMYLSTWVDLMHPADREEVLPKINEHVMQARPYREDFRLRRKDGSWMWISGRGKTYDVDDNGVPHRAVGTHVDITYRKQTEEALKILNKKLNLLSSVTRHDVINQISGIRAYQELLKREIDDEIIREYLEPMIKSTKIIEKKIRFTSDYQDLGINSPAWQNADSVIKSVISSIYGLRIISEPDMSGLEIYADPMLNKVFYNLFENAFRHGGHATEIRVSFSKIRDQVAVVVEDNGTGVAANLKERIFRHGFGSNTGLGLFLVREILEITGISIYERGTEGNGARFEIVIPKGSYRIR